MTIAELKRKFDSYQRVEKQRQKEQLEHNYNLAQLIGIAIGAQISSKVEMPPLYQLYPDYFNEEDYNQVKQDKETELSINRFKAFAAQYNKQFKEAKK